MNDADLRQQLVAFQEQERKDLAARQGQTIRDAGREATKAYKYDRDALRASHKVEDDRRYQEAKDKSQAIWGRPQGAEKDFQQANDQTAEQPQEQTEKRARRSASEVMAEKRSRSRGRTRERERRPRR